jgi:hypothetical protein
VQIAREVREALAPRFIHPDRFDSVSREPIEQSIVPIGSFFFPLYRLLI